MYSFTHVMVGICLSLLLVLDLPFVVVGSLISDTDYLFQIEHRGAFHSIIFGLVIAVILYYKLGKRSSFSFFIGFFSHLALDSLTPMGVSLLWPLPYNFSFNLFSSGDAVANLGIILVSGILILNRNYIIDFLSSIPPEKIRSYTFGFMAVFSIVLLVFGTRSIRGCEGVYVSISDLIGDMDTYDGREVVTNGTICSGIRAYYSSSGNRYQIFDLCGGNTSLVVWKLHGISSSDINENDKINICGTFTLEYTEPEINYVKYVVVEG